MMKTSLVIFFVLPYFTIFYTNNAGATDKCDDESKKHFDKNAMTITVVLNMVDDTYIYCIGKTLCAIYYESKSCLYVLTSRSCVDQDHINDIQVST